MRAVTLAKRLSLGPPPLIDELFRLDHTFDNDPAIDAWLSARSGPLGQLARHWFGQMRLCGDEFREALHDGCPTACFGQFPFAYVNVFSAHLNVGFFQGAHLPDPQHLLLGTGKRMRHVKVMPAVPADEASLRKLITAAYADMKSRVEKG